MRNPVPRVAALHALAGFGRASLTAVIPVLSTMGCQVCPFPTAILSTHGGFSAYRKIDVTESMDSFIEHWESLNIGFEAIYTGFLASPGQIEKVSKFIDTFPDPEQRVVVDPVLGDDGRVYSIIPPEMIGGMKVLLGSADMVTPNFTEAALLLGQPYSEHIELERMKDWMKELSAMGPETVIVTSVPLERDGKTSSVLAYSESDGRFWRVNCSYIPARYPGTGDIFTSVIVGSILQGDSLPIALDRAVQFVSIAIRASFGYTFSKNEGVLLERVLHNLRAPVTISTYEIIT